MRIYTLGTSHGDSTFSRFNSSTAYEAADGTVYLVDAGAPVEALYRRKGLLIQNLRACFVTHTHDDHVGGLPGLIKQVRKYAHLREQVFNLFLSEGTAIEPLKAWSRAEHEEPEHPLIGYHAVTDGLIYDDENVTVTAIRTAHVRTHGRTEGEPCSFAYTLYFKADNITVLHTGDLWVDFSDFPKIAQEQYFDICLCEATHYKPESAHQTLMNAKFGRLLFIHVNDPYHVRISPGWVTDNGEKRLLSFCKELPYPVAVAHDGDEFLYEKGAWL